jgi:membrane-associated protease RseP (regulator of RpoE activity)
MKQFKILGLLALIILITGCATPYQETGSTGGFTDKQISRNEFIVAFSGNGYTSSQRAVDLCLLRCAEVALGNGFHYFILTAANAGYDTSTAVSVGNYFPTGYGGVGSFSATQTIPKPIAANRMVCFREKPTVTTQYFDAQNVYNELSQKYGVRKPIEAFPKLRHPIATIGVQLETVIPYENKFKFGVASAAPVAEGKPQFIIKSFTEGSFAQEAGLQIGDEIHAYDGVALSDSGKLDEISSKWEIGQIVQVSAHRHDADVVVSVKTVFNPIFRFNNIRKLKCAGPVSEKEVVAFEGTRPTMAVVPVAEYVDWENPLESKEEMKRYLVAAASDAGANAVLILNSREEVRDVSPTANPAIGFMCSLLVAPKARLGADFELGAGYENKRVVRRVFDPATDAAGLRIGDNVLAINGIDLVLNAPEHINDCMKWGVGQEVQVTVARDGREMPITLKTIENRP